MGFFSRGGHFNVSTRLEVWSFTVDNSQNIDRVQLIIKWWLEHLFYSRIWVSFFITESKGTSFVLSKANIISAISDNFRKPKKLFSISSFKELQILCGISMMKGKHNFCVIKSLKGPQNFCIIGSLKGLENFCGCRVPATSDQEKGCRISAPSDHFRSAEFHHHHPII